MRLLDRCSSLANFPRLLTKGRLSVGLTWLLYLQTLFGALTAAPLKRLTLKDRRHQPQIVRQTSPDFLEQPTMYNWCEVSASPGSQAKTLELLLGSLERMERYDWPVIERGLQGLREVTKEMDSKAKNVLDAVQEVLGEQSYPEMTQEMGKLYLNLAVSTPQAMRLTSDNSVQLPIDAHQMARKIEGVIYAHADTLSRLLLRLELAADTERDTDTKETLASYIGETHQMLCYMQHVYQKVAPGAYLAGRYPDSDLHRNETETLGQVTTPVMRYWATFGVVLRHREILDSILADLYLLEVQIMEHTTRRL